MSSISFTVETENRLNTGVLVEVWDWEQKGNHSKLGETRINLREMLLPTPYFSLVDQGYFIFYFIISF